MKCSLAGVVGALCLSVLVSMVAAGGQANAQSTPADRPNIVFVITDDQDAATLDAIPGLPEVSTPCPGRPEKIMPCLQELVAERGVTFRDHTAAFPLCCPSRTTFLTGQYGHNHGHRGSFLDELPTAETIPVWLKRAGYATGYVGKYQGPVFFAWHPNHPLGVPPGWDEFWGHSDPGKYDYYGYLVSDNGTPFIGGVGDADYHTDATSRRATEFIRARAGAKRKPFFLGVGYLAPHWVYQPPLRGNPEGLSDLMDPADLPGALAEIAAGGSPGYLVEGSSGPPTPAPRHLADLLRLRQAGVDAPRDASFNEQDVSDKPAFVRRRPTLSTELVERIDRWYRNRLATLLAVDEGIKRIFDTLEETGELDNTYFIFTSDNGWLQGEHRIALTKTHAYEASTRLPLVISGPDVEQNAVVEEASSNVDWAGTILELAGAAPSPGFQLDGMSLVPYLRDPDRRFSRVVFYETFRDRSGYVGARLGRWKYIEYNTGERELYDLRADPSELSNRHGDPALAEVEQEMSEHVARFRDCRGQSGDDLCLVTGVAEPD